MIDAVLPLSPDEAFDLLTDPEVKQWRQVKVILALLMVASLSADTATGKIVLYTVNLGIGTPPLMQSRRMGYSAV